MDVEYSDIKRDWDSYQTDGSSHKMFDSVHEGLVEVPQYVPELTDGEDANIKHDEESNKLDRDRAC